MSPSSCLNPRDLPNRKGIVVEGVDFDAIKKIAENEGFSCSRADKITKGVFLKDILNILDASVIVACALLLTIL